MDAIESALAAFDAARDRNIDDLVALCRIPSVSFPGFDAEHLRESAEFTRKLLLARGFDQAEILEIDGAHPYVFAEAKAKDPNAPTVLLYAHHDVQPSGDVEVWTSPPFVPELRDGRVYGRGTGDDKAGIIVHCAAADAWKQAGGLPVNLKFLIEGEEEVGSAHLDTFLTRFRDRLAADVLVVTDTVNVDTGVPSLTNSLRGMVAVDVEVRGLKGPVHSGLWGGPLPDPAIGLSKMLATLLDDAGQIAVPGLLDDVRPLTEAERRSIDALPVDANTFREQSGLVEGARLLGNANPYEVNWRRPAVTVTAIQASSRKDARNIVVDSAWARVSVRLVPDQNPERVRQALNEHLRSVCPWGLELDLVADADANPWYTSTEQEAFRAALRALERGYGRPAMVMGGGGSIPIVESLCEAMGGGPALLLGIEDPYTNAHGIDESVSVVDLEGTTRAAVHLYHELRGR